MVLSVRAWTVLALMEVIRGTTAPSGRVLGIQTGPKRRVVAARSDDTAEMSDTRVGRQKVANTNMYASGRGRDKGSASKAALSALVA